MTSARLALLSALLSLPLAAQVDAQARRGDADAAYQARMAGSLMPLRSIENGVVPRMKSRGADYIGAEYDDDMARYRLKFMRDGSVIWVDVDGRTGAIVGRAGD
jgi:uncharacterized membrane protein YkoI